MKTDSLTSRIQDTFNQLSAKPTNTITINDLTNLLAQFDSIPKSELNQRHNIKSLYTKCFDFVLLTLQKNTLIPDTELYESMLMYYSKRNMADKLEELWNDIEYLGIQPTIKMLHTVMNAHLSTSAQSKKVIAMYRQYFYELDMGDQELSLKSVSGKQSIAAPVFNDNGITLPSFTNPRTPSTQSSTRLLNPDTDTHVIVAKAYALQKEWLLAKEYWPIDERRMPVDILESILLATVEQREWSECIDLLRKQVRRYKVLISDDVTLKILSKITSRESSTEVFELFWKFVVMEKKSLNISEELNTDILNTFITRFRFYYDQITERGSLLKGIPKGYSEIVLDYFKRFDNDTFNKTIRSHYLNDLSQYISAPWVSYHSYVAFGIYILKEYESRGMINECWEFSHKWIQTLSQHEPDNTKLMALYELLLEYWESRKDGSKVRRLLKKSGELIPTTTIFKTRLQIFWADKLYDKMSQEYQTNVYRLITLPSEKPCQQPDAEILKMMGEMNLQRNRFRSAAYYMNLYSQHPNGGDIPEYMIVEFVLSLLKEHEWDKVWTLLKMCQDRGVKLDYSRRVSKLFNTCLELEKHDKAGIMAGLFDVIDSEKLELPDELVVLALSMVSKSPRHDNATVSILERFVNEPRFSLPSALVASNIARALCTTSRYDLIESKLLPLISVLSSKTNESESVWNDVISVLAYHGDVNFLIPVLENVFNQQPQSASSLLSSFILALVKSPTKLDSAITIYETFAQGKLALSQTVYHGLLSYYSSRDELDSVENVLKDMQTFDVPMTPISNYFMLSVKLRRGEWDSQSGLNTHGLELTQVAWNRIMKDGLDIILKKNASIVNLPASHTGKQALQQSATQFIDWFNAQPSTSLNIITHTTIMSFWTKAGLYDLAIKWFNEHVRNSKTKLDVQVYNVLIPAYAMTDPQPARQIESLLTRMRKDNLVPNFATYIGLLKVLIQRDDVQGALAMFVGLTRFGVAVEKVNLTALLNDVLNSLGKRGNNTDLKAMYEWVMGDSSSLVIGKAKTVISSTRPKTRIKLDAISVNILLFHLAKSGDHEYLERVFSRHIKSLSPDSTMFLHILNGYAQSGHYEFARQWYTRMIQYGLSPKINIYATLLSALNRHVDSIYNLSQQDKEWVMNEQNIWLQQMQTQGLSPDEYIYVILLSGASKLGDLPKAQTLWNEMTQRRIPKNIVAWTSYLDAYVRCGDKRWKMVLEELVSRTDVVPNQTTLLVVLDGCSNKYGTFSSEKVDIAAAESWMNRFQTQYGIALGHKELVTLMDIYQRGGYMTKFWNTWVRVWNEFLDRDGCFDLLRDKKGNIIGVECDSFAKGQTEWPVDIYSAYFAVTLDAVFQNVDANVANLFWKNVVLKLQDTYGVVRVNDNMVVTLIEGYLANGKVEDMRQVLKSMSFSNDDYMGMKLLSTIVTKLQKNKDVARELVAIVAERGIVSPEVVNAVKKRYYYVYE